MIDSKEKLAELAISNARLAMENGNKADAKKWAEMAGQLAPEVEDSWLVLAYLTESAEGLKYLEKVLTLNPTSNRARKGIHYLIKKILHPQDTIPSVYEKFTESESISHQPVEIISEEGKNQRIENPVSIKEQPRVISSEEQNKENAALEKTIDSSGVTAEVISDKKIVESIAGHHLTENTEINTFTVSEPASRTKSNEVYGIPQTFSPKQPLKNEKIDFVSIFISLFGLLILAITILIILYANHLLPFLK